MLSHLTGPPRIGGIAAPYCVSGAPAQLDWDASESIVVVRRGGRRVVRERRLRGRCVLAWRSLSRDLYATLLAELSAPTVVVDVRTRAATDPAWAVELPLEMQVTSELPALADVQHDRADLTVELETVATYAARPDVVTGGYTYTGASAHGYTLDGYGAGTVEPAGTQRVAFGGTVYELPVARLGDDAVAALRITPVRTPGRAPRLLIQTKPTPL